MQITAVQEKSLPQYQGPIEDRLELASLAFAETASQILESLLATSFVTEKSEDYSVVISLHEEIAELRESFRAFIETEKANDPFFYAELEALSTLLENSTYRVEYLKPVQEGISGTYFLCDKEGRPLFVLKPLDEEAGCINNPKWFAGLSKDNPVRDFMPLYRSAMREVLAYQVALELGLDIVPKTVLAIVEGDQFHDFSERIGLGEIDRYLETTGPIDREKLCSVQEYVDNSKPLYEELRNLWRFGLSNQEIAARFDQEDFENASILLWTTYDTDGHFGNFLAYLKGFNSSGHQIFGIKKIDNGLAFPDENRQLRNDLVILENSNLPLSDSAKEKIAKIDIDQLAEQLKIYHLESAIPALRERIEYLQKIVQEPGITIKSINHLMQWIDYEI